MTDTEGTNKKEPKNFAGNAETQTLVLLDVNKKLNSSERYCRYLDMLREKLLKNGANIKENRLLLSFKNGHKEIKS